MNLATHYLGLSLRTPFIVGASPLCDDADTARRLQDAGAGAVVLRSLFEEQLGAVRPPAEIEDDTPAYPFYAEYQYSPDQYL